MAYLGFGGGRCYINRALSARKIFGHAPHLRVLKDSWLTKKGLVAMRKGCIDSMERGTVEWNGGIVERNGGMRANDPVPPLLVICTCAPSHAFRVTLCAGGVTTFTALAN